jgi:hypothetical protein
MREETIGKLSVVFYDSIDELPILRYHKFNKFISIDAGIGENPEDAARHINAIRDANHRKDFERVEQLAQNLQQCLAFSVSNVSPKSLAYAVMIKSIDGVEQTDITEYGLETTLQKVLGHGVSWGMVKATVNFLKKKSKRALRGISRP